MMANDPWAIVGQSSSKDDPWAVVEANDKEGAWDNELAIQSKKTPTAADFGKQLLRGLSSAAGAVGQAGEFAGELTGIEGLRQSGKDIRVGAEKGRQMLARGMTPAGRASAEAEIIREVEPKDRHPLVREALTALGIKAPGLEWGPTPISSAAMQAVESLPGMAAMAVTGGPLSAGVKKLGGKALAEIAAKKGIVGRAAKIAPTAVGYGAAEGGYAGMQNAASIRGEIEQMPIEKLRGTPAFDAEAMAVDPSIPMAQRELFARDEIARKAAADVAIRTGLSTGLIGAATGGGALGLIHRGKAAGTGGGIIRRGATGAIKGAAAEVIQETPQSAAEKYITNLAEQEYVDPSIDPWKGVVSSGLSGGIVGGLTGGVLGAGGAMLQRRAPTSPETPGPQVPDTEISDEDLINEINAAMGEDASVRTATPSSDTVTPPGNVPASLGAETVPPGPRTQEELIAAIRKKSEENIIADLDRKKREEQAAVAEAVARQGEAPTAMEQAFAVAKKEPPAPARAASVQPDILPKSGIPFKTQKSANLFARSNKIAGHEPVNVGVEKWVLRPITPEQTITTEQEAELAALLRLKNAETAQPVSPPIPESAPSLSPNVAQTGIAGAPTTEGNTNAETLRSDQGQMRQGREDELRQMPGKVGAYREQPSEQGRQAANETAQEVALNRPGVRTAVNDAFITAKGDPATAISNLEREAATLRGISKDNPAMAGNVVASESVINEAIAYLRGAYPASQPAAAKEETSAAVPPENAVVSPKSQSTVMGAPARPKAKPAISVNPAKDSLIVAIAKLGGLDAIEAEAQGVDPAYFKRKGGAQSGGASIKPGVISADQAKEEKAESATQSMIQSHDSFMGRVRDGAVTAEEFKLSFDVLVSNRDAVLAELSKETKQALLDRLGSMKAYRAKNEKKAYAVDNAYEEMLTDYLDPTSTGGAFSYGYTPGDRFGGITKAVAARVERTTDEDIKQHAKDVAARREEREKQREENLAGLDDPKTIEDFRRLMRARQEEIGEGATFQRVRMTLTPDQREQYDTLVAEENRRKRESAKPDVTARAPSETVSTSEIIKTRHTKHGHDLWQFSMEQRVSADEFKSLVEQAKRLGGNYSSYRGNGAIPGWQFRTEDAAKAFKKLVAGDAADANEVIQERRNAFADDRSQSAVERLREMADSLDVRADDALGSDRKVNTSRRARMAASAEAAANGQKAMAQTMRNIANAIEDGSAKFLDRVRQKIQVEELRSILNTAKYDRLRATYPTYAEQEKHRHDPLTKEVADYAEFPAYTMYRSDLAGLGRAMIENEGTKKIGQQIMKVADDVTDAYLTFAKENLGKVSRFTKASGGLAVFKSKADAEKAITRSNINGDAVVLPIKRGENVIIMSPSAAMKHGIWQGDGDKRITLASDVGEEIVEKLGREQRHGRLSAPHQFVSAYDKRKRLSGMGIETPSELRAALREFIGLAEAPKQADKIKEMERAMIGRRNDGLDFFPTPAGVADEMIAAADIREGMSVLEPSAGMGHIAERIRETGVDPDVVEISSSRRELLEAKGFNLVGNDFMDTGGSYDRIIMNPPFGDRRDAEHVRHAYSLLKPGGRLVAIMGEGVFFGGDKKAKEFRDWMEQVGATDEKLEEGAFLDPSLPVTTGVNARMVVIDKESADGGSSSLYSRDTSIVNAEKSRGPDTHIVDSATQSILSAHTGKEKAAIQAMMDAGIVKVVTADEAVNIAGEALSSGEGRAVAFFNPADGTTYFIADHMRAGMTPEQVRKLTQHEISVHALHLGKDSKEFKSILSQVELMRKAGNKAVIAAHQRAADAGTREANIPEESLAYLIEQNPDLPIIKRVIAWMRNAIREIGRKMPVMQRMKLFAWADGMTVDDLLWMAQTALARSYKAGSIEVVTENSGSVLASKESREGEDTERDVKSGKIETGGIIGDRFTLPAETRAEQIRRKIQDDAIRIQKVQEAVLKQGGEITEDSDIAKAIKLYPGRLASRIHDLNKKIVDPLLERMTKAGITMDDVGLYKYAMHAKERNAEIAKIRKDLPNDGKPGNSGSGMTDATADEIIKQAEAHPKFKAIKQASDILDKLMDSRLNFLVKEGVMSKDQADAYRAKYKHYVPLKGFENADVNGVPQGTGRGMSTGRKIDFRALGRQSMAKDVFQNIIRDTETAMMLAEKARVGKVARAFVLANPDVKLWSVDKIPKDRYFKKGREIHVVYQNGEAIAEFRKEGADKAFIKQLKSLYPGEEFTVKIERENGLTVLKDSQFNENEEIMFIDGSDVVRIQFTDPLITRAYNRLWNNGVSDGLKTLNAYNGLLRQMYTQKNPAFFVLNAFRDVQAVVPYLTGELGAKLAFKAMGNMIGAKKAAWNFYHQKPLGPVWTDVMNRFSLSGGSVGFAYVGDIEAKTIELEGTLSKYTSWKNSIANVKKGNIKRGMYGVLVKALNSKGIAWIEALNSSFENMSRLATFKAAIDSGLSDKDAAMLAKHVTVNFNARGEWGPNMNAVWLFSNASIQGSRNIGHALLYSKHKGQVWSLAGGLVALGVMAGLMGGEDDDLVRDDERGRSLVFKFGNTTIKWPMPYGWGFFGGMGQLIAQSMKHPDGHDKIAVEMADLTMQHFGIIGNPFAGGSNDLIGVVNLLPTAPKPFAQAAANRSSFGGALYPESPYDETTPDSEKAWRATKGSGYDVIAKWLNDISGGDSAQEGLVSVSPESIKLGVSTVSGGVGRLITDLFSIPFKATSDKEMSPKDFPVFKNFVGEIGVDEYRKRFGDQSRRAKEAYQTYKKYQAKGDMSGADAYLAENEAIVNLGRMVGNYNKQMKSMREYEDRVNNDASMSGDRRKTELKIIENRMIKLTSEFNEKIKDMD